MAGAVVPARALLDPWANERCSPVRRQPVLSRSAPLVVSCAPSPCAPSVCVIRGWVASITSLHPLSFRSPRASTHKRRAALSTAAFDFRVKGPPQLRRIADLALVPTPWNLCTQRRSGRIRTTTPPNLTPLLSSMLFWKAFNAGPWVSA